MSGPDGFDWDCVDCGEWVYYKQKAASIRRHARQMCEKCERAFAVALHQRAQETAERRQRALRAHHSIKRAIRAMEARTRHAAARGMTLADWEDAKRAVHHGPRYAGPPRRGYVYRLCDADGRLLYVGKTYNVRARLLSGPSSHSKTKEWWSEVASVEVAVYRTEAAALAAEAWAIQREAPVYNVDRPRPWTPRSPACLHRYSGVPAA